jgi:hypothetical protein
MELSPIHHDGEQDGNGVPDWGCFTDEANLAVDGLVESLNDKEWTDQQGWMSAEDVVYYVAEDLRDIGEGATDTVVKESVFGAISELVESFDDWDISMIYGW